MVAERTPLQATLPPNMVGRKLKEAISFFSKAGLHLETLFFDLISHNQDDRFNFLDAGCGEGNIAEEFARRMAFLAHIKGFTARVQAIGIDENPLPSSIYSKRSAEVRRDDVTKMATVHSESINLGLSLRVTPYLEDPLGAFQSGWRVLRRGGVMVWDVTPQALSTPDIETILKTTDGANNHFRWVPIAPRRGALVCQKGPQKFAGFPYKIERVERPYSAEGIDDYRRFFTHTHYREA